MTSYVPVFEYSFRLGLVSAVSGNVYHDFTGYMNCTISVEDTGEGTISFECPSSEYFNAPTLLAATPEVAVAMHLRHDGISVSTGEIDGCRFFLEDMEFDPTFPLGQRGLFTTNDGTVTTFSGRNILHKMDFVSPWWNDTNDNRAFAPPVTMAQIVNVWTGDFLANWSAVQNPAQIWVFPPFGNHLLSTTDQFGLPWPEVGAVYRNGTSLGDLFRDWRETGRVWLRSQGRTISPLTVDPGFDRAANPDAGFNVVLMRGRDILEGSRWRETDRSQFNAIAQKFGTFGARARASSNPLINADREVRENYLPSSNVTDSTEAVARLGQLTNTVFVPQREVTLKLAFGPNAPVPFYHYRAGDWIWVDYGFPLGRTRHKIRQLTVTFGEGGRPTEGDMVCETALPPVAGATRDRLQRIYRGFDSTTV